MSDIDLNIIDGGDINLTLYDDGTVNVSVADDGTVNITFDGPSSFQTLSDTPTSYSGQSGKVVTVNSAEDGIEFTDAGAGNVSTSGTPIDNDFAKFVNGTDIEGRSYTEVRTDLNIEDGADVTDATNVASAGAAMSGGAFHDGFSDFVANEHIDWALTNVANIHADNYTDTNTQLSESDISTMGFTKDVEVDWTADQSPAVINAGNYTDTDTTDHTALSNIGTQTHAQLETAIGLNTAKETDVDHNITTNLSAGTLTATTIDVNSSDGTNATLVEADTTNAGILGSDKWDEIVANSLKISYNSTASTKLGTIEESAEVNNISDANATDLTDGGDTTLHDHDGISENTSARHTQDTDTALGSGAVAADHGTATTDQIVNVSYGTSETPPTASTTTEGSLYVQYTA